MIIFLLFLIFMLAWIISGLLPLYIQSIKETKSKERIELIYSFLYLIFTGPISLYKTFKEN